MCPYTYLGQDPTKLKLRNINNRSNGITLRERVCAWVFWELRICFWCVRMEQQHVATTDPIRTEKLINLICKTQLGFKRLGWARTWYQRPVPQITSTTCLTLSSDHSRREYTLRRFQMRTVYFDRHAWCDLEGWRSRFEGRWGVKGTMGWWWKDKLTYLLNRKPRPTILILNIGYGERNVYGSVSIGVAQCLVYIGKLTISILSLDID